MKKLFLMLGSLSLILLGFFIFKNQDIVNAETTNGWVDTSACSQTECGSDAGTKTQSKTTPGYTTPIVCEKTCNGVTEPFSTSRTVYENDYSETIYGEWGNWSDWHKDNKCSSSDENAGKCQDEKDSSKNPDVYRRRYRTVTVNDHVCPSGYTYLEVSGSNDCYKVETFSATITYGEKSNDLNHCHKETPVTPSIPSWASSDFGKLPELKDKVDSNICTGGVWVPEVVENRTVSCTIPENEVKACPVDVCPNLEGNQTEIPEGYELKNEECVEEKKVEWCHVEPNGNSQTLNISENALRNAGHMDASGNPLHAGDHAGACQEVTPTPTPTVTPTVTPEPSVTPTVTPTQEPTPTEAPRTSDVEHTGLSVQKLACNEYDFRAEMEVKSGEHPLQDILVSFTYRGEKKDAYTNKEGYASVYFTFTGESMVKATPINGFESRESLATQETNCQEFGAMSSRTGDSRVLGANTYAKTGVFEDIMAGIMGLSGATMTAVGATLNVKKRK